MDLPNALKIDARIKVATYADDVKVYASFDESEKEVVRSKLKDSVREMLRWAETWKLKVNTSKSHLFRIGSKCAEVDYDVPLTVKEKVRDLGVVIDSSLQ